MSDNTNIERTNRIEPPVIKASFNIRETNINRPQIFSAVFIN